MLGDSFRASALFCLTPFGFTQGSLSKKQSRGINEAVALLNVKGEGGAKILYARGSLA